MVCTGEGIFRARDDGQARAEQAKRAGLWNRRGRRGPGRCKRKIEVRVELRPHVGLNDRFDVAAVVVNLAGTGNTSRDMRWPEAGLGTELLAREVNLGSLEAGKSADLVVMPLPDRDGREAHQLLLAGNAGVGKTVWRGRWR